MQQKGAAHRPGPDFVAVISDVLLTHQA